MCGYIILSEKPSRDRLTILLTRQRNRGTDGYGCIHLESGAVVKAATAKEFVSRVMQLPEGSFLIHHRKASVGGVSDALIHPQECLPPKGDVTFFVCQNGTKRSLSDAFGAKSDTRAIARVLPVLEQAGEESLTEDFLFGAGLVFVYKQHKRRDNELLMWHDGERTLYYCEEGEFAGVFASEPLCAGRWSPITERLSLESMPLNVNQWRSVFGKRKQLDAAKEYRMDPQYRDCGIEELVPRNSAPMRADGIVYVAGRRVPSPCLEAVKLPPSNPHVTYGTNMALQGHRIAAKGFSPSAKGKGTKARKKAAKSRRSSPLSLSDAAKNFIRRCWLEALGLESVERCDNHTKGRKS